MDHRQKTILFNICMAPEIGVSMLRAVNGVVNALPLFASPANCR